MSMFEIPEVDEMELRGILARASLPVVVFGISSESALTRLIDEDVLTLANRFHNVYKFVKLNVSYYKDFAFEYGLLKIPCLIMFHNAKVQRRLIDIKYDSHLKREMETFLEADFCSLSSEFVRIDDRNFAREVLKSFKLVAANFWVSGFDLCWKMVPDLESVENRYHGRLKVCVINWQDHRDLAMQYNVTQVPTLLLFKHGEVVERLVGMRSQRAILRTIQRFI